MLGRPAKEKWGDKNGTIQLVCNILQLAPRQNYYRAVKKRVKKLADGLELNYASLRVVTEDVNTMREIKRKATASVCIDRDEIYTEHVCQGSDNPLKTGA
eukprot:2878694-Ditylum_brightwellii.AAC.1